MWLCTNYGFFSVVKNHKDYTDNKPEEIFAVRSRDESHLKKAFPDKKIYKYPFTDYGFRIFCTQEELNSFMLSTVDRINYTNFKNSVKDEKLHDFFLKIWEAGYNIFYTK